MDITKIDKPRVLASIIQTLGNNIEQGPEVQQVTATTIIPKLARGSKDDI
jgi:hypothetical protein